MGLYHILLGIPPRIRTKWGKLRLEYGSHAIKESLSDRYGKIALPDELDTDSAQVIEVEDDRLGFTKKVVYRVPHDDKNDLVIVIRPVVDIVLNIRTGFVKTVWLNRRDDNHKTLDEDKYDRP